MGICLITVLGTGLLCSNGTTATSQDFCQLAGPEISRLSRLNDVERAALRRSKKQDLVSLKKKRERLCK